MVASPPAPEASGHPRDLRHLRRALELGRRGWGRVHPNPMVGCVVVRGDEVVAEGWHAEFGGDHAEVAALRAAGTAAFGAEVFVSLEPCRHQGKTPPCTEALRRAGVARVVFGASDPGERSGGGAAELAAAGIRVEGPLLSSREARRENPVFFHGDRTRPWVALKLALSLDGGIAVAPGRRTPLSGAEAIAEVHRLRAGFDALLVGRRTAEVDDPLLTVRGETRPRRAPLRVVLDERGTLAPDARLLEAGEGEVLVLTVSGTPDSWREALEGNGARVTEVSATPEGLVDLGEALAVLRGIGVQSVLCEGGAELGSALLQADLVDRLHLVQSGRFLGPDRVPAFGDARARGENAPYEWEPIERPRLLGSDLWTTWEPVERPEGPGGER